MEPQLHRLKSEIIKIISETNGISLQDTIDLLLSCPKIKESKEILKPIKEFNNLLFYFQNNAVNARSLFDHPFSQALFQFFKEFPLLYYEDHIHLTGSLSAEFIYPRLKKILCGKKKKIYEKKIADIYGKKALPIHSLNDVENLILLKDGDRFDTYLKILFLPKLILTDRRAHAEAAHHMARELYIKYNVGNIRLKFTLNRASKLSDEQIPGISRLTEEDVILGLYEGFTEFKKSMPNFRFNLSPCFRKEVNFYDSKKFDSKESHINDQVDRILRIIKKYPYLKDIVNEVDTVGEERDLHRKKHFEHMRRGLRRLQYHGFNIRSHHGETWKTLKSGIQSVDNAMSIWHIDVLEHGLSLGINPNRYFHRLYQKVMELNALGKSVPKGTSEYHELKEMHWNESIILNKLLKGIPISPHEESSFIRAKFYTAREIEHYQHDVLNRMINKDISLTVLPSSNLKLTGQFPDYKDHPFSWWEQKSVNLSVGTDNYITLGTNYIHELLLLLFSNAKDLKITKLLMIATKETRRPYITHLLWEMRRKINASSLDEITY